MSPSLHHSWIVDSSDAIEDMLCWGDNLGGHSRASSLIASCALSLTSCDSTDSLAFEITLPDNDPIPEKATCKSDMVNGK